MPLKMFYANSNKNFQVLGFLFLLIFIVYADAFSVQIPSESFTMFALFKKYGLSGIKFNYHDVGLYLFVNPVLCFVYFLIRTNPAGWIVFALLIHVVSSFLIYKILLALIK